MSRPYRQVARERAQRHTREALLNAVEEKLAGGGWAKTSLESLAANAGVTKQTALRHFGSKEGLLEAAVARASEIVRRERAQAPTEDIPGAVQNLMNHYERWGKIVLRVLAEEHRGALVRKFTDRGRQVHHEWVERTFEPELAALDARARRLREAQLVAVCDVYVWKLLRDDMGLGVADTEIALTEIVEGILGT
ncbi:MAG TPA: TetR/AcrR family transcriptional regulator [Solirubrobacteraceae bacterium]|nr:TetR/AcrR family transcriptional regulator [Solirubrobacteraceae bacterium]